MLMSYACHHPHGFTEFGSGFYQRTDPDDIQKHTFTSEVGCHPPPVIPSLMILDRSQPYAFERPLPPAVHYAESDSNNPVGVRFMLMERVRESCRRRLEFECHCVDRRRYPFFTRLIHRRSRDYCHPACTHRRCFTFPQIPEDWDDRGCGRIYRSLRSLLRP